MSKTQKMILVAYFSRAGEQYNVGNVEKGNAAIIAEMIAEQTNGILFEIQLLNDTYPHSYTALTEAALMEKNENKRPKIIGKVDDFDQYSTIFIGCPNWWGDLPMPVYTFLESYDFSSKIIIPFITHEGSGLADTPNKIRNIISPNDILPGFEITGTEAQNDQVNARKKVNNWLAQIGY